MMWDIPSNGNPEPYQQQQNHPMYDGHNNPLPPIGMPSPFGSPMPSYDYNAGPPAAFPPTSSYSYAGSTSSYLNVPDIPISGERRRATSGNIHHSHHSHHSHHTHHRVHSNPTLLPPVPQAPPQHPSRPRPVSAFVNSAPSNFHTQPQQHFQAPQHHYQAPQHQQIPGASAGTFQYSKCTGKKKALCIGINYIGTPQALRGCINDARHVRDFLISKWGYRSDDIVMLTDDATNPRKRPTKNNIIEAMKWLVHNAQPNDSLVFHYSGHGGQTRDTDGDEVDGHDEVIYPMDYKREGHIVDDRMHKIMVRPLPAGCRLTAIFDCCHSGTVLDLPYIYGSDGRLKGRQVSQKARASRGTAADVISWSGSKDGQTSADTFAGGVAVGAMSYAFITSLQHNPKQTYQELLKSIRKILYPKYSQKPQLGSSHHIDTSLRFVM